MNRIRLGVAVAFALAAGAALAQSTGGAYAIPRATIDGGGGTSTSQRFALSGTIAQPDAHAAATGGVYQLTGGFWVADAAATPDALFANGFE